jgi:hypothetical protein
MAGRKGKASRGRAFMLDVRASREELIRVFDELLPLAAAVPSAFARSYACQLLAQIIDQMDGARDPRVAPLPWMIAELMAALVDRRGAQPKYAIFAAIETLAPERAEDKKFRAFIERTYSKVRRGKNPARAMLVSTIPDALIDAASAHLPRRRKK